MQEQTHIPRTHPSHNKDLDVSGQDTSCQIYSILKNLLCNPDLDNYFLHYSNAPVLSKSEPMNLSLPILLSIREASAAFEPVNELLATIGIHEFGLHLFFTHVTKVKCYRNICDLTVKNLTTAVVKPSCLENLVNSSL